MKKKGLLKFNHLLVNPQSTKITFICGTLVAVMIIYYYVKLLRIHVRKCVKNAPKLESRGGKYICMYVVFWLLKKASLSLTSDKMKALELQTKSMYVASWVVDLHCFHKKGATLNYCVKIFYVVTFLLLLATIYLAAIIN